MSNRKAGGKAMLSFSTGFQSSPVNPRMKALKRAFTGLVLMDVVVLMASGNDGVRYPSQIQMCGELICDH